eukprot:s334_g18.t1
MHLCTLGRLGSNASNRLCSVRPSDVVAVVKLTGIGAAPRRCSVSMLWLEPGVSLPPAAAAVESPMTGVPPARLRDALSAAEAGGGAGAVDSERSTVVLGSPTMATIECI